MRVYIQKKSDGEWLNLNCFSAMTWFTEMGYEIVPFVDSSEIKDLTSETPVVGGIGMICKAIAASGKQIPPNIDFPTSLNKYRYRRIWETTLGEINVDFGTYDYDDKGLSTIKIIFSFEMINVE